MDPIIKPLPVYAYGALEPLQDETPLVLVWESSLGPSSTLNWLCDLEQVPALQPFIDKMKKLNK